MKIHWCRIVPLLFATTLAGPVPAQESPGELVERAEQALAAGNLRAAVRTLERLRFQGQLSDALRLRLAQAYLRQGRRGQATTEAKLIDPSVGGVALLMLKAELAAAEGNWPATRDRYMEVIARTPDHAEAYLGLGQALQELGDATGADEAFAGYVQHSQ